MEKPKEQTFETLRGCVGRTGAFIGFYFRVMFQIMLSKCLQDRVVEAFIYNEIYSEMLHAFLYLIDRWRNSEHCKGVKKEKVPKIMFVVLFTIALIKYI